MALDVQLTGTGNIGEITPGWTVSESINSVAIGDVTAATGSVNFTSRATDDSILVINNDAVSTIDGLGTLHGIVQSVTESGMTNNITQGTIGDKLNLDVQVQPVVSGGPKAWCYSLEYAIGIGVNPYNAPKDYLPSFSRAGYDVSFGFFGSTISTDFRYPLTQFLDLSNGFSAFPTQNIGNGIMDSSQGVGSNPTGWFTYTETQLNAINKLPGWFDTSKTNNYVIQFAARPDSATIITLGMINESISTIGYHMTVDGSAKTFGTSGLSVDWSSLDQTKSLMFTIILKKAVPTNTQTTRYIAVTDHTGTVVSATDVMLGLKNYIPYHRIECNAFNYINFYLTPSAITNAEITQYIEPVNPTAPGELSLFDFSGFTGDDTHAYPATSGIAWELLQQLAAAENFECAIIGDKIHIRDVGTTVFDMSNYMASPTLTPQSTLSGKQIDIPYNNAAYVEGTIYNAEEDGNNILSVDAGSTITASVKHNVNPLYVDRPYPVYGSSATLKKNEYMVMDSSGLPIMPDEWIGYGGDISVSIDPEDNSAIQIVLKGPSTEITLAGGPYEIAVSDGVNKHARLKLSGTGVYDSQNLLELTTGIDPTKYTRATINTINNPFIKTIEQAYDRGIWAAQKASGPVVTLSINVPTSSLNGIGLTCGSLINYRDSTYRIIQSSITNANTSIIAERYVTVADMDALWGTGITAPKTFTMTIASPAVFTSTGHGLSNGDFVSFSTTGELPDNLATSSTIWGGYVINSATNTFQLSATLNGSAINSTGTQSGTHSFITGDKSVSEYDSIWGNYECQDQIVLPYKVA